MSSIPILGMPTSDVVPGQYAQVNFAQGPAAAASGVRAALIIANYTSSDGTCSANTLYGPDTATTLQSEGDAATLFGKRSEARRAYKRFVKVNNVTPCYVLTVQDTGAAATGTITFSATAAAPGFARIYVGEEFVDVLISTSDTVATIATAAIAAINGMQDWPVIASSGGSGIVTLTAANLGVRGNYIRYSARVFGSGVATTVTPTAHTAFTGGTGVDTWTTALTKIIARRFYYIVSADDGGQSGTGLSALVTQVNSQALPATGIRQRVFAGSTDTLANTITLAQAKNNARVEFVNLPSGDATPLEIAANAAALYAYFEASAVPTCNFNGAGDTAETKAFWTIKAPLNATALTHANMVSALTSGVTPIGIKADGSGTYIVKRVTSYAATGSTADYRIRDAHKVTVMDFLADDLISVGAQVLSGKVIGDDPAPGQKISVPNVVTPREVTAVGKKVVTDYAANGLLQSVDATIAGMSTVRDSLAPTRFVTRIQPTPADILDQQVWYLDQLSFAG